MGTLPWIDIALLVVTTAATQAGTSPAVETAPHVTTMTQASALRASGLERSGIARVGLEPARLEGASLRLDGRPPLHPPAAGEILRLTSGLERFDLQVSGLSEDAAGIMSYVGHLVDDDDSLFVLTVNGSDQSVIGKIHSDESLHLLHGRLNVGLNLSRVETTLNVQDPASDVQPAPKLGHGSTMTKVAQGGNVRVLLLYGDDVPGRIGNINTFAANFVAQINAILASSQVPASNYISLAGVQPAGSSWRPPAHNSTLTKDQILSRIGNRVEEFSTIDSRMDALKADIAVVVLSANDSSTCPGNGCALARVGGIANSYLKATPFAAIADTYVLGDLTGPHEVGHILGGAHQGESPPDGAEPWSKGKLVANTWVTIMGKYVDMTCPFHTLNQQPTCPRIARYSNPNLSYGGVPTGDAGITDMASALQTQMPVVASWKAEAIAAPGPVGSMNVSQNGTIATISWTSAAGSPTSYQVQQADELAAIANPDYKNVIYSGPSLSTATLIKFGRYMSWRVRGCNGSGCGPWTQLGRQF